MTNTIAVDITLYSEDGELWASQDVTFDLLTELATTSDGVVLRKTNTVTTDVNGEAQATLAIPDDGYWLYKCTLPKVSFRFTLASDASNTTLEALLAAQNLEATTSSSSFLGLLAPYLLISSVVNDPTLASESIVNPPTESAVKAYVDANISGLDVSGTPSANDIPRFVDDNTLEGLSYSELLAALNVEAGADVTDATSVDAAGATMNADTDVSSNGWVVDEDAMGSNLATKVPTQQSVKAYADTKLPLSVNILAKSGTYEVAEADNGYVLECTGTFTVTFPNGLSTGYQMSVVNVGSGTITLAAATTLQGVGTQLTTQHTAAYVYHRGSNVFLAVGALT